MPQSAKSAASKGAALKAADSSIANVLGSQSVLPGESDDVYNAGLQAALTELGAITPLQSYLVEKIYDCLWWIRRYEDQKRAAIIREMADLLTDGAGYGNISEVKAHALQLLFANESSDWLNQLMKKKGYSMESLQQKAFSKERNWLRELDELIALKTKTLAGFQASFEVLVNRKIQRERLELQNALLRRDLQAIENVVKPQEAPGQ
jgi:hypothetical protein